MINCHVSSTICRSTVNTLTLLLASVVLSHSASALDVGPSAIPDTYIPMVTEDELGARTAPLLELGNPYFDTGRLAEPWVLPTGAVWTPSLWVYGGFRTALAVVDNSVTETTQEWANRLDLITNLQLSGTERVVLGLTPIHKGGNFSKYTFAPDDKEGWNDASELHVSTFFLEAEIAELFPRIDPYDRLPLDIGFTIGRQLIDFQDGFLINDMIDSIGIVKNNNYIGTGVNNARFTFVYGLNEVNRGNNKEDESAKLYGLMTHWDLDKHSIELDMIYIDGDEPAEVSGAYGDSVHVGIGSSQRFGYISTVFRLMASDASDVSSAAADEGILFFSELSTSPRGSENILYLTSFWSKNEFKSASRRGTVGGPLGRTGLLFASAGLGSYKPALSNAAGDVAGGALGYQVFIGSYRTQLITEFGLRSDRSGSDTGGVGLALHFQHRLTQRMVWRMDGYGVKNDNQRDKGFGIRTELRVQF